MSLPTTHSAKDLAESLGRSHRWVLDAAKDGRLPSLKVGGRVRFTQEQVDAIFASFTRNPREIDVAADEWGRPPAAVARERARQRRAS